MGRIEVITRTELRRKYSPAERDAIMREAGAYRYSKRSQVKPPATRAPSTAAISR